MDKKQMKRIGNRIGEARGAEMPPLSQEKTGEKLGVSFQAVSSWERGEFLPDTDHLQSLSKELDLSLDALFDDTERERKLGPVNFCWDHMFTFVKGRAQSFKLLQTLKMLDLFHEIGWAKPRMSNYGFETEYTVHPLTMACHALAMGLKDDDVVAACLAHDVLEDGHWLKDGSRVKAEQLPLGEKALEAVKLVSKNLWDESDPDWEKKYYEAIEKNDLACLVKCLDRVNNVAGMADFFSRRKMAEYAEETDRYYPALLEVLKRNTAYNDAWWLLRYQLVTTNETCKRMLGAQKKKKIRVFFDMDGVLADFDRGVRELCHMETPPHSAPKDVEEKMWNAIRDVGHFYDKLELIPGAKELFDRVNAKPGIQCEILTGIPRPERGVDTAGEDKTNWVRRLLSTDIKMNIVARREKKQYCYGRNCILIDDLDKNIREWEEKGGIGILHRNVKDTLAELKRLKVL